MHRSELLQILFKICRIPAQSCNADSTVSSKFLSPFAVFFRQKSRILHSFSLFDIVCSHVVFELAAIMTMFRFTAVLSLSSFTRYSLNTEVNKVISFKREAREDAFSRSSSRLTIWSEKKMYRVNEGFRAVCVSRKVDSRRYRGSISVDDRASPSSSPCSRVILRESLRCKL